MIPPDTARAVAELLEVQVKERRAKIAEHKAALRKLHAEIVGLTEAQMNVERLAAEVRSTP